MEFVVERDARDDVVVAIDLTHPTVEALYNAVAEVTGSAVHLWWEDVELKQGDDALLADIGLLGCGERLHAKVPMAAIAREALRGRRVPVSLARLLAAAQEGRVEEVGLLAHALTDDCSRCVDGLVSTVLFNTQVWRAPDERWRDTAAALLAPPLATSLFSWDGIAAQCGGAVDSETAAMRVAFLLSKGVPPQMDVITTDFLRKVSNSVLSLMVNAGMRVPKPEMKCPTTVIMSLFAHTMRWGRCRPGSVVALRLWAKAGASVEALHWNQMSPLAEACSALSVECVRVLLGAGAAVCANVQGGRTALHYAAGAGCWRGRSWWTVRSFASDGEVVEAMIAGGADPTPYDDRGRTPLHYAAAHGHLPIVEALLEAGARIDARTFEDRATPLHWAARTPDVRVVDCLLAHGASWGNVDLLGRTPLHIAYGAGRKGTCVSLIRAGASVRAVDKAGKTPPDHARTERRRRWVARICGFDATT